MNLPSHQPTNLLLTDAFSLYTVVDYIQKLLINLLRIQVLASCRSAVLCFSNFCRLLVQTSQAQGLVNEMYCDI